MRREALSALKTEIATAELHDAGTGRISRLRQAEAMIGPTGSLGTGLETEDDLIEWADAGALRPLFVDEGQPSELLAEARPVGATDDPRSYRPTLVDQVLEEMNASALPRR